MADWKGRGKGRSDGQSTPSIRGGAGMGGGRPGSQPSLSISGGKGRGGGNASPNVIPTITGGKGRGGGNASPNVIPTITGGAGKGGGNASPNVLPTITGGIGRGQGRDSKQPSLGAKVEYGGVSLNYSLKSSASTSSARGETSIGTATGPEVSPRVADPEGNFIFALEIEKIEVAQFKEASGLKTSTQVFELEEGGQNHRVHKLPGQSRWDNIVLRYGVSKDTTLLSWRNEILGDEFGKRRNGSIVMKTTRGEEVRRYNFIQGWPVAWEGPSFNADAAELAVEMIEIAHAGVQVT